MRQLLTVVLTAAVLPFGALAADELSDGHAEYLNSCAACHGVSGRGDGPMANGLTTRPADITRLAEQEGGEFPYWRVFAVIDGRYIVPGHGDRDMPVWGRQFLPGDVKTHGPKGGEKATRERILELTNYVRSLQR